MKADKVTKGVRMIHVDTLSTDWERDYETVLASGKPCVVTKVTKDRFWVRVLREKKSRGPYLRMLDEQGNAIVGEWCNWGRYHDAWKEAADSASHVLRMRDYRYL